MSTAGKVIIIVGVCLLVLIIGVVGLGVYWWSHHGREVLEAPVNAMKEGTAAGRQTDKQGCVDQAISRYKQNEGFGGAISSTLFLQGCLEEGRPTPGFCDDVPRASEIMKGAAWQIRKCREAGVPADQYYRQIFAGVQQYCERERRKPAKTE